MKSITKIIVVTLFIDLLLACASNPLLVVSNNIAHLNDSPAVQFSTSGWSYTNTTNPFILTPDYLTNALLGVSRMKPGERFPNEGPFVPEDLSPDSLVELLENKLYGKESLSTSKEKINGHDVAMATYYNNTKRGLEYAFNLKGNLIHVILLAENGSYFEAGSKVAYTVVETIRIR